MTALAWLVPVALLLGGIGLAAFLWALRSGQFEDPFGHRWNVASHVEDVSEEEMATRAAEAFS